MSAASLTYELPDSAYAWRRLVASMMVGTMACAGTWTVVVVMPTVQAEFGTAAAGASLPYTLMMLGFGVGTIVMGRMSDRFGIVVPIIASAVLLVHRAM
jgi:MFS family permease